MAVLPQEDNFTGNCLPGSNLHTVAKTDHVISFSWSRRQGGGRDRQHHNRHQQGNASLHSKFPLLRLLSSDFTYPNGGLPFCLVEFPRRKQALIF
jgi:hypothetical protein